MLELLTKEDAEELVRRMNASSITQEFSTGTFSLVFCGDPMNTHPPYAPKSYGVLFTPRVAGMMLPIVQGAELLALIQ